MTSYLVDTNVFLYARGAEHPYQEPCRAVLAAARDGVMTLEASVEVVQEFTHVLLRRGIGRADALEEALEMRSQCRLHAFDDEVLEMAMRLLADHPALGMRDAVHAATAVSAGLGSMVSTDRVFDGVAGLRRIDPIADRHLLSD